MTRPLFDTKAIAPTSPSDARGARKGHSAISADGRFSLWLDHMKKPRVIDLVAGTSKEVGTPTAYPASVRIHGGLGAIVDKKQVTVVELATGKVHAFKVPDATSAVAVSLAEVAVLANETITFYDATTKKKAKRAALKVKGTWDFVVSRDGVIATSHTNRTPTVTVWTKDPIHIPAWPGKVNKGTAKHLSFTPDGTRLVFLEDSIEDSARSARRDHLRVVDLASRREVFEGRGPIAKDKELLGFSAIGGEQALVVWSDAQGFTPPSAEFHIARFRFGAKPVLEAKQTVTEIDGACALSPFGVLLNNSTFLRLADAPVVAPATEPRTESAAAPAKKAKKAAPAKNAVKATVRLTKSAIKDLGKHWRPLLDALESVATLEPLVGEGAKSAEKVAKALDGEVLTSDVDWPYEPVVIEGTLADATRVAATKKRPSWLLLCDQADEASAADIVEAKPYKAAAKLLEGLGRVTQSRIEHGSDTLLLITAVVDGREVGVLTVRSDT